MKLCEPGWTEGTKSALERLVREGAGKGLPAVFDFDNTIVCGDIGEATLALLARERIIQKQDVPQVLAPSFTGKHGETVSLESCADITVYYEALLDVTRHHGNDPAPLSSGYVWAVEIMQGLTVRDVIRATEMAFAQSEPFTEKMIEVTRGISAYPVPFFYPEMIELIAFLLDHGYDVWIVSASNVWTVRWMAHNALNPALAARGCARRIEPDRVVGVSTLMRDRAGRLCRDQLLVGGVPGYAAMEENVIAGLTLTARLGFPAPIYSGKVANIMDLIGARPYLAAGDSPGDLPMLAFAENRLWLARLEKPDYQRERAACASRADEGPWIVQPVLCKGRPGFIRRAEEVGALCADGVPAPVAESLEMVRPLI
jgi:hypothetical protein